MGAPTETAYHELAERIARLQAEIEHQAREAGALRTAVEAERAQRLAMSEAQARLEACLQTLGSRLTEVEIERDALRSQVAVGDDTRAGAATGLRAWRAAGDPPDPPTRPAQSVTIVHLEDHGPLQEVVRVTAGKFPHARYAPYGVLEAPPPGRALLTVNLLARSADPLAVIADCGRWGLDDPYAFAYCAEGTRGFTLGIVDLFPHPFEPDACATRLLERADDPQRILVVSEDVEAMNALREILGRVRCSTAIAFDARQALALVPAVRATLILVDLALPQGEGLRAVGRLRAVPSLASLPIALLCGKAVNRAEFRQHGLRVAREFSFSNDHLGRAIAQVLGPGGAASR